MFELSHIRVGDAMHPGILKCDGDAPLREVAALMARHRVHAVAIGHEDSAGPQGVVSDLDLVGGIATGADLGAAQIAATEPLQVASTERLDRAAQLMSEHRVSHLVVTDAADGHPIGVLSALDIAALYAGGNAGLAGRAAEVAASHRHAPHAVHRAR